MDEYIINQKEEEGDNRTILQIVAENRRKKRKDANFYMNKEVIEQLRQKSMETAIYIAQNGNKKIWKPDKFVVSRKVKVAEDLNELLERRIYN